MTKDIHEKPIKEVTGIPDAVEDSYCVEFKTVATGRLSSGPNLQNIPIRTELGRTIRDAFIPRDKWKQVDTDYSKIENSVRKGK
jgi:DNA polymerase I-like protein with 3'-5' exonuclease and polymerase domains